MLVANKVRFVLPTMDSVIAAASMRARIYNKNVLVNLDVTALNWIDRSNVLTAQRDSYFSATCCPHRAMIGTNMNTQPGASEHHKY